MLGAKAALEVLGLVDGHRDAGPAEDEPSVRHVLRGAIVREGLGRPHRVQDLLGVANGSQTWPRRVRVL